MCLSESWETPRDDLNSSEMGSISAAADLHNIQGCQNDAIIMIKNNICPNCVYSGQVGLVLLLRLSNDIFRKNDLFC